MLKRLIALLSAALLLAGGIAGTAVAQPPKVKYAKTEVDRAAGKCFGSLIGKTLLGAVVGGLVGGKKGAGIGAAIGVGAGITYCAVIMSDARKRDRIIAAQLASAANIDRPYVTTLEADDGQPVQFTGRASASQTVDAAQLLPVRYKNADGVTLASPVLDTGGQECREVAATLANAALPKQLTCRTPAGDWQPYAAAKT